MEIELDSASTPSSASVHDLEAMRSAASSTPPTSLTSGPSDVADAPKTDDAPQPPSPEPRRSSRARHSVGTYNLSTLVGTNIHTPTKYLVKDGKRTLSDGGKTYRGTPNNTSHVHVRELDTSLGKAWDLDALPAKLLARTASPASNKTDASRRVSRRLAFIEYATTTAAQTASSALGKHARDALKSGKNALKSLTGAGQAAGSRGRVTEAERRDALAKGSPAKRRRTASMPAGLRASEQQPSEPEKPAPPQKKRKLYLKQGLYVGQERSFNPRLNEAKNRKKALATQQQNGTGSDSTAETGPPKESFPPLPMFFGQRLLEEGRDFKLPHDVFCPLPKKVKKPENWSNLRSNRAIEDAIEIYKQNIQEKETSTCLCSTEMPCTRDENSCLNFVMGYECDSFNCAVPAVCQNRPFEELEERIERGNDYDIGVEIMETPDRGYGIRAMRSFKPGQIIFEYSGEIITQDECNRRMLNEYKNNKCYYLMMFDQKLIIDATQKGSMARFVNHSCDPNCQMIKMTVKGKPRMAVFAGPDGVDVGDELTYDYNFEAFSSSWSQQCLCGASNCRGVLGPKPKEVRVSKVKEALLSGAKSLKRKAQELLGANSPSGSPKRRKMAKVKSAARSGLSKARSMPSLGRSKSSDTLASGRGSIKSAKSTKSTKSTKTTASTKAKAKSGDGKAKGKTTSRIVRATKSTVSLKSARSVKSAATDGSKASKGGRAAGVRKEVARAAQDLRRSVAKLGSPASRAYAKRRFVGTAVGKGKAKVKVVVKAKAKGNAKAKGAAATKKPRRKSDGVAAEQENAEQENLQEQLEDQILSEMTVVAPLRKPGAGKPKSSVTGAGVKKTVAPRKAPIKKGKVTVRSIRGPRKGETMQRMGIGSLKGKKTIMVVE